MAHTALARKYRPRRFSEVATQEHVSETLRRAVSGNRVAHAYLFCGPRGVGKTTLARVLAMALNCPHRLEAGEPCGECESCRRIWSGHTSLDVVEIDAASNRGVDDARELRERAMYAPSEDGRYKVYIVDEAHMLTREAWNALLKILEEPPPRVIFVFATTEPQKIQQAAAPILSRCQRFDFRRIGVADISRRLNEVLEEEGAEAPEDALRILARKADGGMRDALSLLDQVLALTGGEIDQAAVRRVLGLVEEDRYLELLDILAGRRHGDVFGFVQSLLDEGYDLVEFYHGLVDVLRSVLKLRLGASAGDPELREDLREAFGERVRTFDPADLVRMLAMATELESSGSLRRSEQPRLLLEMLLLRLAYMDRTVDLEELLRGMGRSPDAPPPPPTSSSEGGRAPKRDDVPSNGTDGTRRPVESEPEGDAAATAPDVAATPDAPAAGLEEAWSRLLATGEGLPPGILPFLRAARVSESTPGILTVELPSGPGLERMSEVQVRRQVSDALGRQAGSDAEIEVGGADVAAGAEGERITPDSVRQDRLKSLFEREPLLERAVEELDLELLD